MKIYHRLSKLERDLIKILTFERVKEQTLQGTRNPLKDY